jgi:hypothetical protein
MYHGRNPMALIASRTPSQRDGSGSIAVALWNIRNGHNGGLESALRTMEAMNVDLGILMETKVTGRIYTQNSSGYSVIVSNVPGMHQGGIVFFWRVNKTYTVKDWLICGPNMLSFVIVTGRSQRFYIMECYILPSNLNTLPQVKHALNECPKGHTPLLIGDLNVKLCAPRDKQDKRITEVVEDNCGLTNLSKPFRQQSRGHMRGVGNLPV